MLEYGRKDGDVSILEEANAIPTGKESATDLIMFFQSMGLTPVELVTLQGTSQLHFFFFNFTIQGSTCEIEYSIASLSIGFVDRSHPN